MIPPQFEYFSLLVVYALLLLSLFSESIRVAARERAFWVSLGIFVLSWSTIELVGLGLGMWEYSSDKLCGVAILGIPIEEYVIFVLIHMSTVASWKSFKEGPASCPG